MITFALTKCNIYKVNTEHEYLDVKEYVMYVNYNAGLATPYDQMGRDNTAQIVVSNSDKRFSPDNTSSPYYPFIVKGACVMLDITAYNNGVASTNTITYSGFIARVLPSPGTQGERTCTIECEGWFSIAQRTYANMGVLQNIEVHEALQQLCQDAPPPPCLEFNDINRIVIGRSKIDSIDEIIDVDTYFGRGINSWITIGLLGDWGEGTTVYGAAREIVSREGHARFYQKPDGNLGFWSRGSRGVEVTFATFTDQQMGMDPIYGDVVRNEIHVKYAYRTITTNLSTIGTCTTLPTITAGSDTQVKFYFIDQSTGLLFSASSFILPVHSIDFTATAAGISDDLSPFVSVTLTKDMGYGCLVNFHNNYSQNVTLSTITIRGTRIVPVEAGEIISRDDTSILAYGLLPYTWDGTVETSALAQTLADELLSEFATPMTRIINFNPKFSTADDIAKLEAFATKIHIDELQSALSDDYYVVGETVQWRPGYFDINWILEPT
jgi:hypothetical protein